MNIAILVSGLPTEMHGGTELQADAWADRLSRRHRITVITRSHSLPPLALGVDRGVRTVLVSRPSLKFLRSAVEIRRIRRCIADMDPRPDVLLCFGTAISGFAGLRAGTRLNIPTVVWVRGEAEYRLGDNVRSRLTSPQVWEKADAVLVQSEAGRQDLLAELERASARRLPIVRQKLDVIGNGVEMPESSPWNPDGPVLSVGRLVWDKGMQTVIEACAAVGAPLVIAGRGPERPALEKRAAALGADVRFTGFVDRKQIADLYRAASVVVLASRREGLPNVLLEAMAHCRPVIATPRGGITSLIDDGVNGLLVEPDDPAALANALNRLASDPAMAAQLAVAGRATAEEYAWERIEPRLEEILERVRRRH